MTISTLITQLEALRAQHGDIRLAAADGKLLQTAGAEVRFVGAFFARVEALDDEPRQVVAVLR